MELSEFLDAYLDCGNTLLEAKAKDDIGKYLCMFAGLTQPPSGIPLTDSGSALETLKDKDGTQYGKYETKAGKNSVYYIGTGCKPEGGGTPIISFDETDWTALLGRFKEGAELTPGDAPAGSPQEVLDAKEQAKQREVQLQDTADAFGEAAEKALADVGFTGKVKDSTRTLFRQIAGIGGDNAIRKAARQRAGEEIEEVEEDALRYQDSLIVNSLITRVAQITKAVRNDGNGLTDSDRKFMKECLRLRGRGKDRGIYVVPSDSGGDACGGDLMQAAIPFQKGGDRYGVKIGNHNSPIYEAGVWLHEQSLKKGNPLYDEGNPAIFWGGTEASRMNSYRAMDGVLNEHGPKLAQTWIACGRKMPCPAMSKQVEGMLTAEQFNLNLLIFGAEQRNAGTIPDEIQYTDIDGDGNELILDDIEAAQGEVDGPKALAWYVGSLLNSWDAIVSDPMFDGCDFEVVGRGPTGQQKDGGAVNQDVQVTCDKLAKKLVINKKNQVKSGTGIFGDDGDKNRDHYTGEQATGINVKTSNDGTDVQYGKRGCAVIDGVLTDEEGVISGFTESTERARNRHANYLYGVAEQNGEKLTEKDKADADKYKMDEINTVNGTMQALAAGGLSTGTVSTVMKGVMGRMGYEEGEEFSNLQKVFTDYQNADNPSPERTKAEKQIRVTLTNAYRNKNQNKAGFRLNMAIEYCQTGMATQNQGFVITKPGGGKTYTGSESDGIGTAAANIMGYGREGGPAPITSITGTGVNFEGGIGLRRRLKEGVPVQEAIESTDSILPRMKELSNAKTPKTESSAMKAEDFVRQLQELVKGIDKVLTV